MDIHGKKIAMVTGGARRIGRAIALHLHGIGFDIALHFHRSASSAQALADELCARRAQSCELFQANLQDAVELAELTRSLVARYDAIHLLVNNASGFAPTPIESCSSGQFDHMLATNLRAPYFLIQGLLPQLRAGRAGVVNLLDVHIDRPLPHYNVYGAAKAGLASLTRSLAVELAPEIRVNGISPGAILWPEEAGAFDASTRDQLIARTPLQRLGDPADIARAVGFLACDAPFMTGQILVLDGGRSLVG